MARVLRGTRNGDEFAQPVVARVIGSFMGIAPEEAVNTRVCGQCSRTASSSVAVEPAIAASVWAGRSQESGTNEGAARW